MSKSQEILDELHSMNEPAGMIKSFADKSGKSEEEVEKLFDQAKKIAAEAGQKDNYAYITGVLKKSLGL